MVAHEEDGNKDIVKRVIGLPGDTIRYENDKLYINGQETDEPYLANTSNVSMRTSYKVLMPEQDGRVLKVNILEILLKKHQHLLSM